MHGFCWKPNAFWGRPEPPGSEPTKESPMRKAPILIAAVATSTLLLSACGGEDDSTPSSSASSSSPATEESSPSADEAAASAETITDIVAANPDFSTLLTAVQAAGLGETLAGDGPFTVFAPTNEAFAKLPADTLAALLEPANKDQLTAILTYHVVPDEVMAAEVQPGEVTTVNGEPFTVAVEGGGVEITDGQGDTATVTATDIEASNGVIHVIDSVLQPAG
jgi:uncharacterized surface protein with fasciclin (FAS1) repeats